MLRRPLLLFLLLAGCSKGPEADLSYISGARSLAAEWALVNEQASQGHLTDAYVRTMRKAVRQQLQTNATSLSDPNTAYAQEIAALLREPDDARPAELRAHASKLKQIEDSLESS
ncbi:MAG TPA: hypothetical protein VFW39_10005 [Sphingomicrobium sp.]|nr:hypothetical protein [Sphingomicrobium sp.]